LGTARAAGLSAVHFTGPPVIPPFAIGVPPPASYTPLSSSLREESARLEADLFGRSRGFADVGSGFWVRQRSDEGQSVINAKSSSQQGIQLAGVSVFKFDDSDQFVERIEAKTATLNSGFWRLEGARVYVKDEPPADHEIYDLRTNLTLTQVRESFATPDTVPFWQLSAYIRLAENAGLAAAGYRV